MQLKTAENQAVRLLMEETRLLLTPRESARRLAISERLLWQLTADGAIPSVRVGKRGVRYDVRDLVAFIDSKK